LAASSQKRWHKHQAMTSILALAGWLLLCLAAGAVGALASANAPEFYGALDKPAWAPPANWFGPVWTFLYLLMGIAAWLVWKTRRWAGARGALGLFIGQLALNALWTWIFFVWRLGGLALAEILLLALFILATIAAFWRIRPLAGALLVPYLLWVAYATALTAALWQRNPELL
jgi:translocator protein